MGNKWRYSILFVLGLFLLSSVISSMFRVSTSSTQGNILFIEINGPIVTSAPESLFGSDMVSANRIASLIRNVDEDESLLGVLLSIDSPGGGAVASQEIVQALKDLEKPSVSVIRTLGASGAYWVASATDKIYSNPLSLVGSIGVTSSYLEFSGLLERYNITYERIVSAEHKDIGSPLRPLSDDERNMLLEQINLVHDFFVNDVAYNRNVEREVIDKVANGHIFMGQVALQNGLIDDLGNLDDAVDYLESLLNTTITLRKFSSKSQILSLFGLIGDDFAFNFGKGFASWVTQEQHRDIISLK